MAKNKGGRPRHHTNEIKKAAIAVRTAPSIRDALQRAAEHSGRSITQEVEARLVASFERDAGQRSPETERLLNMLGSEIADIERLTRKRWHKDRQTAGAVLEMMASAPPRYMKTDDPAEDEIVSRAWDVWFETCSKRKDLTDNLLRLGLKIQVPSSDWLSNDPDELGLGRWRERQALDAADLPDEVRRVATRALDELETLDAEARAAKAELDEAIQPFHEAEESGRQLYRQEQQRLSQDAFRRLQALTRSMDVDQISAAAEALMQEDS